MRHIIDRNKRSALCIADPKDPDYLSLYSTFNVYYPRNTGEARNLLFQNSFDVIIIDADYWPGEIQNLVSVVRIICSWVPVLLFHSFETKELCSGLVAPNLRLVCKTHRQRRMDDVAEQAISSSEIRLQDIAHAVSPELLDQYDSLVRLTHGLFRGPDLMLSLDVFVEEMLDIFPDIIASVVSIRTSSAGIFSRIPMDGKDIENIRNEIMSLFNCLSVKAQTAELEVSYYGPSASRYTGSVDCGLVSATPILERQQLTGLLVIVQCRAKAGQGADAMIRFRYRAKHMHESFMLYNSIRTRAITEPLSRLYNWDFFNAYLKSLWSNSRQKLVSFALLMLNIDNFKSLNESHGQLAGDNIIRRLSEVILEYLPAGDVAARFRGDDFYIILHNCDYEKALPIAQHLIEAIRRHDFGDLGVSIGLTVSMGIAVSNTLKEKSDTELLDIVSRALMLAKHAGRNQICDASELKVPAHTANAEGANDIASTPSHGFAGKGNLVVVDDEPIVLSVIAKMCRRMGYEVTEFGNAFDVIAYIQSAEQPVDVVLTDIMMPDLNGIEMARKLVSINPDIVTVAITGAGTMENTLEAMRAGIYNLLKKPISMQDLEVVLERAVERSRLKKHYTAYRLYLERTLQERTQALQSQLSNLKSAYGRTLTDVVALMDQHGPVGTAHHRRVGEYAAFIAQNMGVDNSATLAAIRTAGFLHDIGKIGVPDRILLADAPLSDEDKDRLEDHAVLGYNLVKNVPIYADAAELIYAHHERWDGRGYPRQMKEDQIPLGARILALVDMFDNLRFDRPSRRGCSLHDVVLRINQEAGSCLDPEIVKFFNNHYREMDHVFMRDDNFWDNMTFGVPDGDVRDEGV